MQNGKLQILFMQSQPWFQADSQIQAQLMRQLDRSRFGVHAACTPDPAAAPAAAFVELAKIPNLHLRPTDFGPSLHGAKGSDVQQFRRGMKTPTNLGNLLAYVRRQRIDVIHCSEKPRDAFYGYWLARLSGAKLLIHLHIKVEEWLSPLSQWAMRRADSLVSVSHFVKQSSIAAGFPASITSVIHNGLDGAQWRTAPSAAAVRPEFQATADEILLVAVARLATYKGQAHLLRALAQVKEIRSDFKLLIVGAEDPHQGNLAELQQLTDASALTDHIHFTGFRRDVAQLMAAADIFALPSYEEPFGMVFLEAMARRKPVLALASGGVPEIVNHGQEGLLAAPNDVEALARHIVWLMDDETLRRRFGAAGQARVAAEFTSARMTQRFAAHYQQITQTG